MVLFICIHNSARSQMAEAYLRHLSEGRWMCNSAGLEPGQLNERVVTVLKEDGIDISSARCKSIDDVMSLHPEISHLITVCDESSADRCPTLPGLYRRLHWSFPDPSSFQGSDEEILEATRSVRDAIKQRVQQFLQTEV